MKKYRVKGENWCSWWLGELRDEDVKFIKDNDIDQLSFHILKKEVLDKLEAAGMNSESVAILRKRVKASRFKELNLVIGGVN